MCQSFGIAWSSAGSDILDSAGRQSMGGYSHLNHVHGCMVRVDIWGHDDDDDKLCLDSVSASEKPLVKGPAALECTVLTSILRTFMSDLLVSRPLV